MPTTGSKQSTRLFWKRGRLINRENPTGTCIVYASVAQIAAMDIKLIRAFIASPSGLEDERRAAFAAASEINKSVAMPMGGRLELIGWEETLSGNDRPQALINAEMETCDLFIGAIWTSWGSRPSIDGPYTSGFEEEFELSRARYERNGNPAMAMFFKSVDPTQLRDPGIDLQKVLEFQKSCGLRRSFSTGLSITRRNSRARSENSWPLM